MIKGFADKETEKIYKQKASRKLSHDIQRIALRKLIMMDNAGCLEDLKVPPGIVWNSYPEKERDNTAFGSMISSGSVSE